MGWVINATPRPLYPQERPRTHFIGGWVGLSAILDWYRKFRPAPGFDPWTVQPVAGLYTDCAVPAHNDFICYFSNLNVLAYLLQKSFPVLHRC